MKIALEDLCEDIVGKAQRGLGIADELLARAAKVPVEKVAALRRGGGNEGTVRAVAPVLGLAVDKLVACFHRSWYPEVPAVAGLFMSNQAYHDMRVNAYLVWHGPSKTAAIFDTGSDASPLLEEAAKRKLAVEQIFLTHTHNDHVVDLPKLRKALPSAKVFVGEQEHPSFLAEPVAAGDRFILGGLTVEARHTWGHTRGGITYVISGLEKPLALVGDAIFAGSMGGGMVSYEDALRTNREEIMTLPDETVLCPGHGPLTTVGQEKAHNPFFGE